MGLGRGSPFAALPARLRSVLRRPDGFTLLIAASALLGAALVMARQIDGVGLTWDAVNYIGVARNLLDGDGFVEITGRLYTLWAPLYPVLLAAASFPWLDPQDVAGPLNAAAFGLAVVAAGAWLRRRIKSRFLAAWGVLAVALSLPLAWAASVALVTIPFSLFILLALINTEQYLHTHRKRNLILASCFSALAWATHYTGIALVVFAAGLLALQPNVPFSRKAKRIGAYGVIASLPIGLWMMRNFHLTGFYVGDRGFEPVSFLALLPDVFAQMSQWIFVNLFVDSRYGVNQWPAATALAGIALLLLAAGVAYALSRSARNEEFGTKWSSVSVLGGFAVAYSLAITLLLALGNAKIEGNDRYPLPAYLPLLLGAVSVLDNSLAVARRRNAYARVLLFGALAGLSGWLALSATLHPLAIREANAYGVGSYGAVRHSEVLAYVSENLIGSATYSNDAPAVYVRTRGRLTPEHRIAFDDDGAYIIWFHGVPRPEYAAADIRGTPGVEDVADLADGAVFRINAAHDPRVGYRAAQDALAAREPAARAVYDLHLDGRTLSYVKSPCSREETAARFFLHVAPTSADDLPDDRKRYGFDNLDFAFRNIGVRFDETCMAIVELPAYPIAEIRTGQFADGRRLWEARFPFSKRVG